MFQLSLDSPTVHVVGHSIPIYYFLLCYFVRLFALSLDIYWHCEVTYVGMTTPHLLTRFREHKSRSSGPIKKHFTECTNNQLRLEDMDILTSTVKSDTHLLALEALYIKELKPYLYTQNAKEQEFKSRQLRVSF